MTTGVFYRIQLNKTNRTILNSIYYTNIFKWNGELLNNSNANGPIYIKFSMNVSQIPGLRIGYFSITYLTYLQSGGHYKDVTTHFGLRFLIVDRK